MKKNLLVLLLIALILPSVALASWWNPFSWFKKALKDNVEVVVPKEIKEVSVDSEIKNEEITKEEKTKNPTSSVLIGTFKNIKTGAIFNYVDYSGYLFKCREVNCKIVYFDLSQSGRINQIQSIKNDPLIGEIYSASLDKDKVNYVIKYESDGKNYLYNYSGINCAYYKGGDKECFSLADKGQPVIIDDGIIIFNKLLKANVLGIESIDYKTSLSCFGEKIGFKLDVSNYEFCIPYDDKYLNEIKKIDETIKCFSGSTGRIGCKNNEYLCLGNNSKKDIKSNLCKLSSLEYVDYLTETISEN